MNILVLGDGNFSFSLCFLRLLEQEWKILSDVQISNVYCTSYDSYEVVMSKYPEFPSISQDIKRIDLSGYSIPSDDESMIKSKPAVKILHNIDATASIYLQLQSQGLKEFLPFDYIIFNFPHLGVEDYEAHSSLIAHIMYQAKQVMHQSSYFVLALSNSQMKRWKMMEMALRVGLYLDSEIPMWSQHWPGYEFKRHQSGKSFRIKVDHCIHYCFTKESISSSSSTTTSTTLDSSALISNLFQRLFDISKNKTIINDKTIPNKVKVTSCLSSSSRSVIVTASGLVRPTKRTRVPNLTKDLIRYLPVIDDKDLSITEPSWECLVCHKRFQSEQGVQTHCYTTHLLHQTQSSSSSEDNSKADGFKISHDDSNRDNPRYSCSICSIIFTSPSKVDDHVATKHGRYNTILPREKLSTLVDILSKEISLIPPNIDAIFECDICGWKFMSETSRDDHRRDGWKPIDKLKIYTCIICDKSFREERALRQHMNYCEIRNNVPTRISLSSEL